jgi:hypothetical protein
LIFGTDILEKYGECLFILNDESNEEPIAFHRPFEENKNEYVFDIIKINGETVKLDYLLFVLCELYGKDNIKERLNMINVTYDEIDSLQVIEY